MAAPRPGERFMDLAAGTGAFSKALRETEPEVRIIAGDFCIPILMRMPAALGRRIGADALNLPVRTGVLDGWVIAFGVRNFSDPSRGLREMNRVLKPGGRGLILEFLRPEDSVFGWMYRQYLSRWVPLLGGILTGSFSAYRHLTTSIQGFLTRPAFRNLLETTGYRIESIRELTFGAATAILVRKNT